MGVSLPLASLSGCPVSGRQQRLQGRALIPYPCPHRGRYYVGEQLYRGGGGGYLYHIVGVW